MAPLAAIVADRGWRVSGCDLSSSDVTAQLQARGVPVAPGHDPAHAAGQELLVVSSAVPHDAPEVAAAEAARVPVVKRARLVGALTRCTRSLCVAGTAGKTTTTAMCAVGLLGAGLDPSALVGAAVPGIGVGGRSGRSDLFVVEADEFDRTFLSFRPLVAVVTNVEADHLDYYGSREAIDAAFRQFMALVPPDGRVVLCRDDPGARALAPPGALGYGTSPDCDWRAEAIAPTDDGGTRFAALGPAGERLDVRLRLPGRHNALNALAAIAACQRLGADPAAVADALGRFEGAARRFE